MLNSELLDNQADEANDVRAEVNSLVSKVLSACSGEADSADARTWWDWSNRYSGLQATNVKSVVVVDERPTQPNNISYVAYLPMPMPRSCLVAGTPIRTERGFKPIEEIQSDDRVLSKDLETGELCYKPVLQTTIRPPTSVAEIRLDDEAIVASAGHHFWVSGDGWKKTRQLAVGTALHTATGTQRISALQEKGPLEAVYILVVADFHTYSVGQSMVLSHDVSLPRPTNAIVPGLAAK